MTMVGNARRTGPMAGMIAAAALVAAPAVAQDAFGEVDRDFGGEISVSAPDRNPVYPGTEVTVAGEGFTPGQRVTLRQNGVVLNSDAAYTADDSGEFSAMLIIPEDAVPGIHPVLAEVSDPAYGMAFDVKVSPDLPESGDFRTSSEQLVPGLYQVAYSADLGAIYVTSAVGRPPVEQSELLKLDPESFEIVARITPEAAPARQDGREGGVYAVYGVGVDAEAGQVWVTNTRQDTVAVYSADDLSLIRQFEDGLVPHPRDAVVHEGKVYVSATFEPQVHVFDTETLEHEGVIELSSTRRRESFGTASLQLDPQAGRLYVASLTTNEIAVVDLAQGEEIAVYPVPRSVSTIGVGHDPETDRIFTAAQGSDNVTILNGATGEVLHEVLVGAGPLNVAFDTVSGLAYVANRGSGTVTMVTPDGEIAGNVQIGSYPNHLIAHPEGGVLVVNKRKGEDDETGDHITRIIPES